MDKLGRGMPSEFCIFESGFNPNLAEPGEPLHRRLSFHGWCLAEQRAFEHPAGAKVTDAVIDKNGRLSLRPSVADGKSGPSYVVQIFQDAESDQLIGTCRFDSPVFESGLCSRPQGRLAQISVDSFVYADDVESLKERLLGLGGWASQQVAVSNAIRDVQGGCEPERRRSRS